MYCVVIASIAAGTFVQFCIFSKWSPTTLGAMSHAAVGFAYLLYFTRETWLEWEFNYPALDSILLLLSGILLGFGCHTCGGLADNCGTISTKYLGDLTAGLGIAIILATSRGSESYFRLFLAACNILTLTFIHAASRKETNAAPPPNGETPQTDEYDSTYQEYQDPIPMRFLDVLQIPSLVGLAIALGLSEIAHMLLYFWLPTILCMTYDPVTANALAATYSIGMLVGASGLVRFGNARTTLIACRALLLLPLIAASLTEFGIHLLLIIIFLPLSGLLEARYVPHHRRLTTAMLCFQRQESASDYCRGRTGSYYVFPRPSVARNRKIDGACLAVGYGSHGRSANAA